MLSIEPEHDTPRSTLIGLRIVWGGFIIGAAVLIAITATVGPLLTPPPSSETQRLLFLGAAALLVVGVLIALFVRNQTYKAHWRGNVITPGGYRKANLLFFSILDGVAFLLAALLAVVGLHWGILAVAMAAWLVMVANFPSGKPMQPHEPHLPEAERL